MGDQEIRVQQNGWFFLNTLGAGILFCRYHGAKRDSGANVDAEDC